jgi:transcriptional regulator with XRE-family HTH domain
MDDSHFGMCLREVRQERGLTREQLAELLGAGNAKTVWAYESGQKDPRVTTVRRFAEALGVDAGRLLGSEGEA